MQTTQKSTVEQSNTPLSFVGVDANFDFTSLESGTPLRVSPQLIDDLSVGGNQRRKKNRSESFADSIRTKGVIQSLSVRPSVSNPNRLELCAGYGRRDAALQFELESVPVIVNSFTNKEALAVMLTENRDREDTTIVDEADLAQKYLSFHDGNYKTAAIELGLSEAVFRDRLKIKRCSEAVLDHLADDESPITLGHALILSTFDEETQGKTLAAILSNPSEYTVEELKLRASQRQIPLSKAVFNTTACNTCKHNTGEQLDLLGDGATDAKCSFSQCFIKKSQEWVKTDRVAELEEKFGKVIVWEAKPESDRREVSEENVGKKQFNSGCMNCESKCVVVDDRPMRWGQYIENQCIDTDCFTKCESNLKAEVEKKKAAKQARQNAAKEAKAKALAHGESLKTESEANTEKVVSDDTVAEEETETVNPIERKTSAAVLEDYRTELRATSATAMIQDGKFRMALALASLCDVSGYSFEIESINPNAYRSFNDNVLNFMDLEMNVIQEHMAKAVVHHATVGDKHNYKNTDLMIAALKKKSDGKALAQASWLPTKTRLAMYNIAQIQQLCKESGFSDAYKAKHGEKEVLGLFKKRKDDVVSGVIGFKFDWSGYAPSDYLALVS